MVRGTAEVTRDSEVLLLRENESVYLPLGCTHRLANPGRIPVEIIEVQTGAYLEEDDMVRIADDFGRNLTLCSRGRRKALTRLGQSRRPRSA